MLYYTILVVTATDLFKVVGSGFAGTLQIITVLVCETILHIPVVPTKALSCEPPKKFLPVIVKLYPPPKVPVFGEILSIKVAKVKS